MKATTLAVFLCLVFMVAGCALTPTKGKLPRVDSFEGVPSGASLVYRVYSRTPTPLKKGVTLDQSSQNYELFGRLLRESNYFESVKEYPRRVPSASFYGGDTAKEESLALEVKFPVEADLFLDIEEVGINLGPHGYAYLMLLHGLTLGFFPLVMNNDVHFKMALHDRDGKLLRRDEVKEESTIWGWTPLFFFNGFKLWRSTDSVKQPLKENTAKFLVKRAGDARPMLIPR